MKELRSIKYVTGGGFGDERDINCVYLEFYMTKYEKSCLCGATIGNKSIQKNFSDKTHPILNNVCDLLNKVNYEEIGTDFERSMWLDAPTTHLEYKYDDESGKVIEYPNCKGLLLLLSDFLNDYLLKDEELQAIFKAIISCDPSRDYLGLNHIVKNKNTFDINKDYEVDKINTIKPDMSIFNNTSVTNKSDNKEVTMDDLLARIDEKIAEIEETK